MRTEVKVALLVLILVAVTFLLLHIPISDVVQHKDTPMTGSASSFQNWTGLFSFIPLGLSDCAKLFSGKGHLQAEFEAKFEEYQETVKHTQNSKLEGYSAKYKEEFLVYIIIAGAPFVKTVCETGFNAGHSTFTWLEINPNTHVYTFDIGQHEYSRPIALHLQKRYPGRFNITWGDSTRTLPAFHRNNPDIRCDLIVIDGGHTKSVCQSDYDTFKHMANHDNIILLDNYPDRRFYGQGIGVPWEEAKQKGEIADIMHCSYQSAQGFSVGRIITENVV